VAGAATSPETPQVPKDEAEGAAQSAVPVLNGILFSDRLVIAIVSDAIAKTGDLLDGYRITSITRDTVVAEKQGRRHIMTTRRPQAQLDMPPPAVPGGAAAPAVKASPLARKLAGRQGVHLAAVRGTGPGGKVMKADVLAAARAPAPAAGEVVPLTAMRRIVAERMLRSKQTIPCYYLQMDADMTDLADLRARLNAAAKDGKIAFNDFVIKACALALKAFPQVNSRWVEGGIERRAAVHVGLAVALDEGLIVPVVRNADAKTLHEIACETADLAQRARSKRLLPDEYQEGCLTVSNLGMFGIRNFIPVVNPGESAILGLGVIQDRVVCCQGNIKVRKVMSMTLSADHRLVDGAVGAQFLERIRDLLEAPQKLAAP